MKDWLKVVLVCGGRTFRDRRLLDEALTEVDPVAIVHGGAPGADSLAGEWAILHRVPEIIVPAQWEGFGRGAGPIRNGWMLRFTKVNLVVAFPGGPGTKNMIEQALRADLPVMRFPR